MLMIDNAAQKSLITMRECVDALERAFVALASHGAALRPKTDVCFPCSRPDGYYRFGSMEGAFDGIHALRFTSEVAVWHEAPDGTLREEEYCIEPGRYCGLVFLFSTETGGPLAMLHDGHIQHMRVGASAGLGAKYLAREDARTVAVIGAGGMARTSLAAICEVRPIERARIYSPTAANREACAREVSAALGIEAVPVASAREAMRGADVVATCTNSMAPVFDPDWLEPGMYVTCVGTQEIDPAALPRFDVAIRQGIAALSPPPALQRPGVSPGLSYAAFVAGSAEEVARLPTPRGRRLDASGFPIFADLATGKAPGRRRPEDIALYYNHGNQGLQFAAVGGVLYRNALKAGAGQPLPDAWFLETEKS